VKLLLLRFSALGDVALLSATAYAALEQNEHLHLGIVSKPQFEALFPKHPRLTFIGVDLKQKYQGVSGLWRLAYEFKANAWPLLIDEHQVLRTWILSLFFRLHGGRALAFPKGRFAKWMAVHPWIKSRKQLTHTAERYAIPLRKLGLAVNIAPKYLPDFSLPSEKAFGIFTDRNARRTHIGIAPLAKHESKTWGIDHIAELIKQIIADKPDTDIWLFGGKEDISQLDQLLRISDNVKLIAGQCSLRQEMDIIRSLDVMLSMDSGNMHLASLCGTPVVSIWGGTHPVCGFAPLFNEHLMVQSDLPCRPCTIYGRTSRKWQKKCYELAFHTLDIPAISKLIESQVSK
jgi:ADP-heptose:LPS heptosyltransferase